MISILKNELFEAFANASEKVYIYVCDMKDDISRWSLQAIEYFDLPGEYMENAGNIWLEKIHPDDREVYGEDIQKVFSGQSSQHHCQYRAKNRYGNYVWLECRGYVIYDDDGEPKIFAGLMTRLDNQNKYDSLTHLLTGHEFQYFDFNQKKGSIILVGIDNFRKMINTYGYSFGNRVLVEFGEYLQSLVKDKSNVFRLQGDEFILVLMDVKKEDACTLFQKWMEDYKGTGFLIRRMMNFSISAGVVEFPADGEYYSELLSNLECSLEFAKSDARGSVVPFSHEIANKQKRTTLLQQLLTRSIKKGFEGFSLYYQPLITNDGYHMRACEALLRWKSKEIQDSYPYEFIKLLENSGEICEVGLWVMEEVLKKAKKWQKAYGDFTVSFNVSALQMMNEEFVDKLIEKTAEYQVNPESIIIELTESCNAVNLPRLNELFDKLKESGFKIAMDDFGIAYSSLELIRTLPMDVLKIDRSFVSGLADDKNMKDRIIIESVVSMCKKLSIDVVAEGIETTEIENVIRPTGVKYLQGYLYSRPVPEDVFEELLRREYCIEA